MLERIKKTLVARPTLWAYVQLMRLDRPVGIYLLLWPTWWALWLAAEGWPSWRVGMVFTLGVVVMRSAGCVINDYADRHWDGEVKRTAARPLVSGLISPQQALVLFVTLLCMALGLLLLLEYRVLPWAVAAVLIAAVYPFCKRFIDGPQLVLGAAFSWGIPMAFVEIQGEVPWYAWLLFVSNLLWTVAYDTYYAMVDRDDDLKVGIKSTAIWFGHRDLFIVGLLQITMLLILGVAGIGASLGFMYFVMLLGAFAWILYGLWVARHRDAQGAFRAFLESHWLGFMVWLGIFLSVI